MWTWLHDSKNAVHKDDRVIIIGEILALFYAKNEDIILTLYNQLLKDSSIIKYPNFIKHLNTHTKKKGVRGLIVIENTFYLEATTLTTTPRQE